MSRRDHPLAGVSAVRSFEDALARMNGLREAVEAAVATAKDRGIDEAGIETALTGPLAEIISKIDDDEVRQYRLTQIRNDIEDNATYLRTGVFPDRTVFLSGDLLKAARVKVKWPK
jgi:hypothetical protein